MRVNILCLAACFALTLECLTAQEADTFPEYTPDKISEIRNEFSRQVRFEDGLKFLRAWQAFKGVPATYEDSIGWYSVQDAMARTFFDLRQMDSSEIVLKPILDVSPTRFPRQCLQIQNSWGVRLNYGGRFADAKKHYEKLRILLDTKVLPSTPEQYCNTLHNLGVAYSHLGDTDAALEVFHHVEDVVRESDFVNLRLQALLQLNLASAYSALGDYGKSLEHSRNAYALHLKNYGLDHPETGQTLNSVANGMKQTGDVEGALKTYQQVLDIYDRIGRQEHPLRAVTLLNVAETLDKIGRTEEAMEYILPCIAIRTKAYGMKHSEVARSYKAKGTILGHLGRFDEAVMSLDTALLALGYDPHSDNPYSGVDAMFNLFYTLDHRADVFYDRVKRDPAETNLVAARDAYINGIHVLNDLRVHFKGKLAKGNLNHKSYSFYEPAIDVSLQLYEKTKSAKDLEQAMQWSGESKGNDFYDLIRGENAMVSAKVPDSIRTKDDQFQQDLAELSSAWYDVRSEDQAKVSAARQILDDTKQQYRSWLETVEKRYPRYYDLLYANTTLDIKARRAELISTSSQLIEYFVGDSNAYAFVLTSESLHYVRLAHPRVIEKAVHAWRDQVAASSVNAQEELSKLLWHPLSQYLREEEHIVIIPDGILSSVPFEILQSDKRDLLLDNYNISYDYASRNAVPLSNGRKNQKWLGLAPEYDLDGGIMAMASRGLDTAAMALRDVEWMKLPGAKSEVQAINELAGGEQRIGKTATERFFRTMAGKFGILHLSMHAWTDDDEPLLSTLIFSEDDTDTTYDGRLYAHEIFQLDLPARLAVLSACNTGVGAFRRGEGISSLARAFMYAGTEATVMSLWKVPDESTAKIMQAFYKHLKSGKRKDEALRDAKLDYLNSVTEPEQKTPYFWAGFILMGDTSPVYGSGFPYALVGIIGGLLLLGGLMIWMKKRAGSNS